MGGTGTEEIGNNTDMEGIGNNRCGGDKPGEQVRQVNKMKRQTGVSTGR